MMGTTGLPERYFWWIQTPITKAVTNVAMLLFIDLTQEKHDEEERQSDHGGLV